MKRLEEYREQYKDKFDLYTVFYYWTTVTGVLDDERLIKQIEEFLKKNKMHNSMQSYADKVNGVILFLMGTFRTINEAGNLFKEVQTIYDKCYTYLQIFVNKAKDYTFEEAKNAEFDFNNEFHIRGSFVLKNLYFDKNIEQVAEMIYIDVQDEQKYTDDKTVDLLKASNGNLNFGINELDIVLKRGKKETEEAIEKFLKNITPEVVEIVLGKNPDVETLRKTLAMLALYADLSEKYYTQYRKIKEEFEKFIIDVRSIELYNFNSKRTIEEYENRISFLETQLNELKKQNKYEDLNKVIGQLESSLLKKDEQIIDLEEENKYLKEIISLYEEQPAYNETIIEPFVEPVNIIYYGLFNNALAKYLYMYNVIINFESPTDTPHFVPDTPIVFNIDVAKHTVWNKIKDKKPLLVRGSNAQIIGEKIINFLKERRNNE